MSHRRGTTAAGLLVAALVIAGSSCSDDGDEEPMDDRSESTARSSATMADALQRSQRAFLDSAIGLRGFGYVPTFGYTQYAICTDEGADWRASANGRLDRQPPTDSSRADAEAVRDELASVGWAPDDTSTSPDGIRELTSHWIVTVERDDLTINVSLYANHPYVLMRVLGPCLPATPEQRREYESAPDERFAVPTGEDT